jgi:hypothetical protein
MKQLLKKLAAAILIAMPALTFCSGEIKGKITEPTGQPAIGAMVRVLSGDNVIAGTTADADGKYSIKPIEAGKYDVVITYPEYLMKRIRDVEVQDEEAAYVDVELKIAGLDSVLEIVATYVKPVVDPTTYTMHTVGAEAFNQMAVSRGDLKGAIVAVSSDVFQDNNGDIFVRGSRSNATGYFIDGEKVIGNFETPALSIQSVTVITGGIPAQYGDLTGGAVIITTKDYFSGMREKRSWQKSRIERDKAEAEKLKKKEEAEKRAKEIEEEKKKAAEEKQKKESGK